MGEPAVSKAPPYVSTWPSAYVLDVLLFVFVLVLRWGVVGLLVGWVFLAEASRALCLTGGMENVHTSAKVWRRFAAVGDSFTEGMMDEQPGSRGEYRGWADILAANLARTAQAAGSSLSYANLAVRGRLVRDVVGEQVDAALAMNPDLVALSAGGNDVLKRTASAEQVRSSLADAAQRIRATGADVLMATGPHVAHLPFLRRLNGAFGQFSANVHGICVEHGCFPIDVWSFRPLRDQRMWAPDRIHLSTLGHARIADVAAVALGLPPNDPHYDQLLPVQPSVSGLKRLAGDVEWVKAHLVPWCQRRLQGRSSGDGVQPKLPEMVPWT